MPQPLDALVGQAGDLAPEPGGLVVVVVDGDPDASTRVEAEAAVGLRPGDQLPGELDGAFLEVVAEGEVAVHLEERAVPGGLADLLDVEGAHALLHAGRALVRRRLLAEQVGLERHHAGVDEQQVGVVEQQRRARARRCGRARRRTRSHRRLISAVSIRRALLGRAGRAGSAARGVVDQVGGLGGRQRLRRGPAPCPAPRAARPRARPCRRAPRRRRRARRRPTPVARSARPDGL